MSHSLCVRLCTRLLFTSVFMFFYMVFYMVCCCRHRAQDRGKRKGERIENECQRERGIKVLWVIKGRAIRVARSESAECRRCTVWRDSRRLKVKA